MDKVILIIFIVSTALIIGYIFFGGKKKSKKSKDKKEEAPKGEKKVEQVIKSEKKPSEEKKEETQEPVKIEMPEQDSSGFKIIRKQSKIKISKKALQSGSRNPSVTRVFDKNAKKTDFDIDKIESIDKVQKEATIEDLEKNYLDKMNKIERFGAREVDYKMINKGNEFSMINKTGDPNRAPIITDRTNFASHLNVTKDNNFSGISGTGIKSTEQEINETISTVDDDTEKMIKNVKKNFLDIEDDINPFDYFNRERRKEEPVKEKKGNIKVKDIDLKTLILADAISNPKFKKK